MIKKHIHIILPVVFGLFFYLLDLVLSNFGPTPITLRLVVWNVIQASVSYWVIYSFIIKARQEKAESTYVIILRSITALVLSVICTTVAYIVFRMLYPGEGHNLKDLRMYMIWITMTISFFEALLFLFILQTQVYFTERTRLKVEREQLHQESIKAQFEILKSEINPHYLFNNFNTLYGLIQEDPTIASEYLLNFSQLFRYILSTKEQDTVSLREELKTVKAYLYVLKERYQGKLLIEYDIMEPYLDCRIVPMGLQILIENAIKHNQIDDTHPLNISIQTENDTLLVVNNCSPKKYPAESNGQGLQNLTKRYQLLTGKPVQIEKDVHLFKIKLPLINSNYEHTDH